MENRYVMNTEKSETVKKKQQDIAKRTQEAYNDINTLLCELQGYEDWQAPDVKPRLLALLDILVQFHRDFCAPLAKFSQSFDTLVKGVENYESQSNSYKELEKK